MSSSSSAVLTVRWRWPSSSETPIWRSAPSPTAASRSSRRGEPGRASAASTRRWPRSVPASVDPLVAGKSFCAMLSACDRAGELERASEWTRIVTESVLERQRRPAARPPHALPRGVRLGAVHRRALGRRRSGHSRGARPDRIAEHRPSDRGDDATRRSATAPGSSRRGRVAAASVRGPTRRRVGRSPGCTHCRAITTWPPPPSLAD